MEKTKERCRDIVELARRINAIVRGPGTKDLKDKFVEAHLWRINNVVREKMQTYGDS